MGTGWRTSEMSHGESVNQKLDTGTRKSTRKYVMTQSAHRPPPRCFHEEAASVNQFSLHPSDASRARQRAVSSWSTGDPRGLLPLSTSTPPGFHSHS